MWSPVTAIANAVLFFTPHRGRQILLSDSGEGDIEKLIERDVNGKLVYEWVENDNRLACVIYNGKKRPPQGMLLKLSDSVPVNTQVKKQKIAWEKKYGVLDDFKLDVELISDNSSTIGLYTTTNKTAKLSKGGHRTPYIPERLIHWLIKLRDWQEKYNPIEKLTDWTEVVDNVKESTLKQRHSQAFLFRDPTSLSEKYAPLTHGKAFGQLAFVLSKVETAELPLTELVRPEADPSVASNWLTKYTPHCLRVSLITAYILDGEIAPHIVQKMVGHHSLIMTLYYTKVGQGEMRSRFTEAEEKMLQKAPERIKKLIYEQRIEELVSEFTSLDQTALKSISNAYPAANYGFMDIGICMQSCAGCDEGGPLRFPDSPSSTERMPVPKGYLERNCPCCRYFFTGPAFISGLQAIQNEIMIASQESSERMEQFIIKRQEIEADIYKFRVDNPGVGAPVELSLQLNKFQMEYQNEVERIDVYASDITRIQLLVKQCLVMLNKNIDDDGVQLVSINSVSEIEAVIEDCSDIRMYYEGVKNGLIYTSSRPFVAVNKASDSISKIASKNGLQPKFYELSDKQKLVAAKQFMDLLLKATNYSWSDVEKISSGELSLADLKTGEELVEMKADLQLSLGGPDKRQIGHSSKGVLDG